MIVVVEDNKIFSKNLIRKLKKEGINDIVLFESVESYNHIDAELYIIDIQLEKKSFELISDIRKKSNSIIIVLSGYSNVDYIIHSLESGGDIFIDKITNPKVLVKKIQKILQLPKKIKGEL